MRKIVVCFLALMLTMGVSMNTFAVEPDIESSEAINATEYIIELDPSAISGEELEQQAEPRIDKDFVVRFTSTKQKLVTTDNPILNQDVTISCEAFSDNISTIKLGYMYNREPGISWSGDLSEGGSYSFYTPALGGWKLYAKVTEGSVSSSDEGVITLHISDK